ncbi:hypothetical protein [Escherichia coli]|uniref:hypothetical protein n=1 Tax=Escherichia coli TaxID=562 RepID=UPI001F234B37|nr:hypothetical protein [Escherichia coli]
MNNSKHTVIEVDTNLVEIEKGFNPREAVIGDLCYRVGSLAAAACHGLELPL